MAIDKSIRQYYDSGMLVKKRADGKRPGYGRWDDPGMSLGTSQSGGARDDPPPTHSTPVYHAPFQPPQRVATYTPAPDTRDHEEQAVGTPFENIYTAPTDFAPTTGEGGLGEGDYDEREIEFLETGDYDVFADTTIQPGPKVDISDIHGEWDDPDSVSFAGTDAYGKILYDPEVQAQRTVKAIEKAEKKSGILKTLGNVAMAMVPGLLPAKYATAYRVGKLGYDVKKGKYDTALSKIGFTGKDLDKKIKKELAGDKYWKRGDVDTTKEYTQDLTKGDERRDDIVKQVSGGEDVVTETAKKFAGITDEQRTELIKRRNIVQGILDQGVYNGTELTAKQRNNLINYIEQISKFIVNPIEMAAHGGRIDKALGGRSRDI